MLGGRVGEVVESTTVAFTAQCYQLNGAPPFGSLVRVDQIYGLVARVQTGSLDAGRRVAPRGSDEADATAVYQNNPELGALLRTELEAVTVGYHDGDRLCQRLPAQPPRLHGFVIECGESEIRAFGEQLDFLDGVVRTPLRVPIDELIGACLRQIAATRDDPHAYLVAAGKRVARLVENDVVRLSTILRVARA